MNLIDTMRIGRPTSAALLAFALALTVLASSASAGVPARHHARAAAKHHTTAVDQRRAKAHRARHGKPHGVRALKRSKPISQAIPAGTGGSMSSNPPASSSLSTSRSGGSHGSSNPRSSGGKPTPPSEAPAPPPAPPATEPTPPPAPPPSGQPGLLMFNGSFTAGLGEWYEQAIPARVNVVPGNEGGQAARFEVREGDIEPQTGAQRAEVVAPPMFDEGQDLYIHDEIRIPAANSSNAPWQIIQQLHEDSSENSPGVAVFLENNHSLRIASGNSRVSYWNGPVLQTERWYDLTYRVLLSQNSQVGTVEVWLDGLPQRLVNGSTAVHGPTATASRTFFKMGIYRSLSSTGTSIVEHGDLTIGSSLAAVEG